MKERDQVLLFIKSKGSCDIQISPKLTCRECILDLDCDPENDSNICTTRYKAAIEIGLRRRYITKADIFDEVL